MPQDSEQSVKERIYLQNVSPRTVAWYRESFKWLGRYELTEQGLKDFVIGMRDAGLKPISCNSRIRVRTPISNGLDWNTTSTAKRRGTGVRKETNHLAMPKITQSKFAQILAARTNKTVSETADFLDAFKSQVYELLNQGHVVELSGMGQFSVSHRNPRTGYNPRTHDAITIPELNTPKFKAGEAFKEAIRLRH